MRITLTCHDCELCFELDERPQSGNIRCPSCRTLLAVPAPGESGRADKTYAVPQVFRCPKCKREMEEGAKLCINCGYNVQTGKQLTREVRVREVHRSWEFGFVPFFFTGIELDQTRKGGQWLAVTQRVLGIPLGTTEIDLRDCKEIWTDFHAGFGIFGWVVFWLLCIPCFLPGWYYYQLAYYKHTYYLRLPYRNSYVTLYKGWSQATMKDILESVCAIRALEVVRK
jgi:hypothetical protein